MEVRNWPVIAFNCGHSFDPINPAKTPPPAVITPAKTADALAVACTQARISYNLLTNDQSTDVLWLALRHGSGASMLFTKKIRNPHFSPKNRDCLFKNT